MTARGYKVNLRRFPEIARLLQAWLNKEKGGYLVEVNPDGFLRLAPDSERRKQIFELSFLNPNHNRIDVVQDGTPFAELIQKRALYV